MNTLELSGEWNLKYFEEGKNMPENPTAMRGFDCRQVAAQVPGNVELDLSRAGVLPEDIFYADKILKLRDYEAFQWWYEREFVTPQWVAESETELVFEGLDCFATIWVNDVEVGKTNNATIGHRLNVTDFLKPAGGTNVITVRLASPVNSVKGLPIEPDCNTSLYKYASLWARKPAHCYGWDIMPRAISAGIWRPVYLAEKRGTELEDVQIDTLRTSEKDAIIIVNVDWRTDLSIKDFSLRVKGVCGDSTFSAEKVLFFQNCGFRVSVENPRLWWPRGYGEANLYDVTVELVHKGKVVSTISQKLGIRTIELERTDIHTEEQPGKFQFRVNGEPVFCRGGNWVPADAFHSRDAARIPEMLKLFSEMECNMLRCWGGNVYEPHEFYDICDREGIMVWQDFSMACAFYPQHNDFKEMLRIEAEWVVKELRRHPSIALWCGDNENDQCRVALTYLWGDRPRLPDSNSLTREVLAEVMRMFDPARVYLPSSAYITDKVCELFPEITPVDEASHSKINLKNRPVSPRDLVPEIHIYPRGDFKDVIPAVTQAIFASEIGYLGSCGSSSLRKFISPENLWPVNGNIEWCVHSTDSVPEYPNPARLKAYFDQIEAFFDFLPESLEEFTAASQIVQAEGCKFLLEIMRQRKGESTGLLWWNMIDGWPQLSDSVVDYYHNKKLAFHYMKRAHGSLAVIVGEPENGCLSIHAVNDSLEQKNGHLKIWDADGGKVLLEADFAAAANGNSLCGSLPQPEGQKLWLIEWECNGEKGCSHYLCGKPPFDYSRYMKKWLPAIAELDGEFDVGNVGK